MKQKLVVVAICWMVLSYALACFAQTQTPYEPIPSGFDFPGDQTKLLGFRDSQNVAEMRKHVWMVFAGLTQKAAGGEAIWETWFSAPETFQLGPTPQGEAARPVQRVFQEPRQFRSASGGPHPQAIGESVASFTLFNKEARAHIRANNLNLQSKLNELLQSFGKDVPIEKREIPAFPPEAVVLKTTWWIVKKTGLTPMPIWDPVPRKVNQPSMPHETWKRFVAIDPGRTDIPLDEKKDITFDGDLKKGAHVVPLAAFYNFALTQAAVDSLRTLPNDVRGASDAQVGDYLVLAALHCTTKEIPDWVWATFWWHDKPNEGAFASNRTDQVFGVWKNYLMDTSYSSDIPKESDNTPHATLNPWLEARFPNGANSNCMACHQRSVWQPVNFLPITRGSLRPNDPFFLNRMKLDFLWSIGFESR